MSDPPRLLWLLCLGSAAQRRRRDKPLVKDGDGIASLLLDRRLVLARDRHVTSFISGTAALFLLGPMVFPDSTVLDIVPSETLDRFTFLISKALPAVRRFKLLFRSSRDGATAAAFHRLCDRQGPTLTLIRDTDGNVFGGYAAVEWSSGVAWTNFRDPAAFLFTVVNPHADPPVLFASKATAN